MMEMKKTYIDLYKALEIHEKYHLDNNLIVSGGAGSNFATAFWDGKKYYKADVLGQFFCIDTSKISPEWFTTNNNLLEDMLFCDTCLCNDITPVRLLFLFYSFHYVNDKNSLICGDKNKNIIKGIETFLLCKNKHVDIKYKKDSSQFPITYKYNKTGIYEKDSEKRNKIKELYGDDKNINAVIDYLSSLYNKEIKIEKPDYLPDFFE